MEFPPHTTRSRLILEVASELSGKKEWPYGQARVTLREQGGESWQACLFASDTPDVIDEVARREVDVAIINPAGPLALAYRGTGPFKKAIPLRVITVIPSLDQFGFAVSEGTGLTSLSQIRERRFPLRVSLRGQRNHSVHFVVKQVLEQVGFSIDDITTWGGQVRYDRGIPNSDRRIGAVQRGEADAIFDEAILTWVNPALELGMRFLSLEEPLLKHLEALGFRRAKITKANHPKLPEDVTTLDFSGWPVYTHAEVSDQLVTAFCAALEARKDLIPWEEEGRLPLERMCRDTPEGPLDIPLHPAAERFWKSRGYLP